MESVFLRNGRYTGHVGLWLRPHLGCFGEESFKSITTAWPNAFSVRPSLALTRSELPSSETGGLVSPLAGFMHGVPAGKAGNVQAAFHQVNPRLGTASSGISFPPSAISPSSRAALR